jgi:hypothetical protein
MIVVKHKAKFHEETWWEMVSEKNQNKGHMVTALFCSYRPTSQLTKVPILHSDFSKINSTEVLN